MPGARVGKTETKNRKANEPRSEKKSGLYFIHVDVLLKNSFISCPGVWAVGVWTGELGWREFVPFAGLGKVSG